MAYVRSSKDGNIVQGDEEQFIDTGRSMAPVKTSSFAYQCKIACLACGFLVLLALNKLSTGFANDPNSFTIPTGLFA